MKSTALITVFFIMILHCACGGDNHAAAVSTPATRIILDAAPEDTTRFRLVPVETLTVQSGDKAMAEGVFALAMPEGTRGRGIALEFDMDQDVLGLDLRNTWIQLSGDFWIASWTKGMITFGPNEQGTSGLEFGLFISGQDDLVHQDPSTNQTTQVRDVELNGTDQGVNLRIGLQLLHPATAGQVLPFKLRKVGILSKDGAMVNDTNIQPQTLRALAE